MIPSNFLTSLSIPPDLTQPRLLDATFLTQHNNILHLSSRPRDPVDSVGMCALRQGLPSIKYAF